MASFANASSWIESTATLTRSDTSGSAGSDSGKRTTASATPPLPEPREPDLVNVEHVLDRSTADAPPPVTRPRRHNLTLAGRPATSVAREHDRPVRDRPAASDAAVRPRQTDQAPANPNRRWRGQERPGPASTDSSAATARPFVRLIPGRHLRPR